MPYLLILVLCFLTLPKAEDLDTKKIDYAHKIRRMNKSLSAHVDDILKARYKLMLLKQKDKKILKAEKELPSSPVMEEVTDLKKPEKLELGLKIAAPVKAEISNVTGKKSQYFSKGIQYKIEIGSVVSAPVGGEIIFAAPFKEYGKIVIIEQDIDNLVLIAGLTSLNVKQGDRVFCGQKIGNVTKNKWIYLEVRHKGEAIPSEKVLASVR